MLSFSPFMAITHNILNKTIKNILFGIFLQSVGKQKKLERKIKFFAQIEMKMRIKRKWESLFFLCRCWFCYFVASLLLFFCHSGRLRFHTHLKHLMNKHLISSILKFYDCFNSFSSFLFPFS